MQRIFTLLLVLLLISPAGFGQKKKKKKDKDAPAAEAPKKKNDSPFKPYSEIVTKDAITDEGLFTTHKVKDNYYFEISDSLMEREILVISRISGTVENLNFGGAGMKARGQQVIRWQRKDNQLLLRSVSHNSVASEETPIYQSVRNNNFEPVIATFDIKALSKDSAAYVIDVADLFTSDVEMIGALNDNQRKQFQVRGVDKKRSLIMSWKSFPLNTEVRHILTYNAGNPPANGNTGTLSIEMNQSMVLLPKKPMTPRLYDERVGFFSVSQIDYGLDEQKATQRRYITRWRLEPSDLEAYKRGELVEPKKQIVYYIDPATPTKWRPYIKQGIEDWQKAFEAAGFKNAIIAKDPPTKEEDPDWSPEDVRYSVVRYTANPIQNAQGPHVHDPRSGEIIESDIIWYHNVMNLLRNWYFVQTAAVNEKARKVKFDDAVMGDLIRFVSAHEVGHTLGFPHNMGGSYSYPVDSLRSPSFTARMGTAPSIMDYARFNYVAQPGDNAALYPQIGVYDKWAVKWGYTYFPETTDPDSEEATLDGWVKEHSGDQMYWYGRQTFNPVDPRAQTEDLGNDAMLSSSYGVANLKRIVPNLIEWTTTEGKNYDDLNEIYGQVIGQWNRYNGHVRNNIGGLYETFKTADQDGAVYEFVPKEKQKRAMTWLQENTFATPTWMLERDIIDRIEGVGSVERISNAQENTLNQVLDPARLERMFENEAMNGSDAYTPIEMMSDLRNGIWSELRSGSTIDIYRRNLQRAYIARMHYLMTEEPSGRFGGSVDMEKSDIRPLVRAELKTLRTQVRNGLNRTTDRLSRYHLEDAIERIDMILDPNN
ncbi:zinc-dependent metalloprotease [Fulvivirga sedimenti]|uniref:Zinc-dependent metalloprotease n=1 Tax=Fulvivirga sedimenti TaxID=2879465 RepID=A0A9X1KZW9_9BACT|nr:zinc-dependent metalloprotease [Fulvivirga sedimenti]MCA6075181.1 zinc-dependent metalloprotease [Fulvivirga sedimenti]MCA6076358.1 zinc-dependent metalloprotease [Fulvivirga sedimenti]MCA6077486.1 zinc-dependent metalloprotease [Fulvivirga sedimenti]